jgi:hypothetical protein
VTKRGVSSLGRNEGATAFGCRRSRHDFDFPEVAALVAELEAFRWVGRRGYGARAMLGACIMKALCALPTWTRVADLIADNPRLAETLGGRRHAAL